MSCCCCVCIEQGSVGLHERFGKFLGDVEPGCMFLVPCVDRVHRINCRVQALTVRCESKTEDNVFVHVDVCVQYRVKNAQDYHYKLDSPNKQITAYVFDVIRAEVPKLTLDLLFLEKTQLSHAVKDQLDHDMTKYGVEIINTPVTDIDPDKNVKKSLNEMNTQKNLKMAMTEKAEADAIVQIKRAEATGAEMRIKAEADAEAKYQAGLGLSRQRKAIVDGLAESVQIFQEGVPGVNPQTVMDLIMITQYFDMMEKIGCAETRGTNTLFIPNNPGQVRSIQEQLRQGMLEAQNASSPTL